MHLPVQAGPIDASSAGDPRCSPMICEGVFLQSSLQSSTPWIAVLGSRGARTQHDHHHPRPDLGISRGSGLKSESRGHCSSSCQARKPRRYGFKRPKFHRLFGGRRPKKNYPAVKIHPGKLEGDPQKFSRGQGKWCVSMVFFRATKNSSVRSMR